MDTVEANLALGFRDDERDYSVAAHMLMSLKVKSIRLMTNNPRKISGLQNLGITVSGRIPLIIPPNPYNRFYLETKEQKSGHMLGGQQDEASAAPRGFKRLAEQLDRPVLEGMSPEKALDGQDD
jgi:GTP cyclohydrolase II